MNPATEVSTEAGGTGITPSGPPASVVDGQGADPIEVELLRGYVINFEAFRQAAIRKGLFTGRAIAKATQVHPPAIARLMRGEPVSLRTFMKVAKALELKWPEDVLVKKDAA